MALSDRKTPDRDQPHREQPHALLIEEGLERAFAASQCTYRESAPGRENASGREATPKGPARLAAAMRHAIFAGGARVRPKLCLAVARGGGDAADMKAALGAGVAIELMHCASLVHDDLPCFDDADTRRGAPSVHRAYGEPLAVLAGDALIVLAFQTVLRACAHAPALAVELSRILGEAVGSPVGIIAGQAWESEDDIDLRAYHRSKTGALFVAACEAGAAAAGLAPADWRALGARLGEAYQIADDIRDVMCPEETLGKPTGVDSANNRPNSVHYFGLEGAREQLHGLIDDAVESIPEIPGAARLRALVLAQAERLMQFAPSPQMGEVRPAGSQPTGPRSSSEKSSSEKSSGGRGP